MSCGSSYIPWIVLAGLLGVCRGYECPLPTGQFADPKSCKHFYSCNDNYPYRLFCPEGSLYDGAKNDCVDRRLPVTCGPQPTTEAPVTTPDPFASTPCNQTSCLLPNCFCSVDGTAIPGNLDPKQVPQMIMLTFDGSVNHLNFEKYNSIFKTSRVNPNGCPIKATFFMSHEYTNYQQVEKFYSEGHEMAVGSISRRAGLEDSLEQGWSDEMLGMSVILNRFAGVNDSEVIGMRAPHLTPGKNAQFESLINDGFFWDSSLTVPPQPVPVWPYTLDYSYPHECKSETCPTRPYQGVWELPMNSHFEDEYYSGGYCPYLDQCVLHFLSEEELVTWLTMDFNRYYNGNRAPYMLTLTANWFNQPTLVKGLQTFIDNTLKLSDVYYVTGTQVVEWMYDLTPVSQLKDYPPWSCKDKVLPVPPCNNPKSCKVVLDPTLENLGESLGGTRYMVTCSTCPRVFPWVADPEGRGI